MTKNQHRKGGLGLSFFFMTAFPILLLGVILTAVGYHEVQQTVYHQVESGMINMAHSAQRTLDILYPGEFSVIQSDKMMALAKGEKPISDDFLLAAKEDNGLEISIIYGEIRMLTSIRNHQMESLAGSVVSPYVKKDVMSEDQSMFYTKTSINNQACFAYYEPIHDREGEVVGALEVIQPAKAVNQSLSRSVVPLLVIAIITTAIAGGFSLLYGRRIRKAFDKLLSFLKSVQNGNLSSKMPETLYVRQDEIGDMARASEAMQYSLRELVEKDALTKLYNRRYANQFLKKAWKSMEEQGVNYCVCIGDIDFFKKVNDTYGHDAGDLVLQAVANILREHMAGKGMIARWGGEEFLFTFENMEVSKATQHLWEILGDIRETVVEYEQEKITFTMSYGVVEARELTIEQALKAADERLYYAKEHGRNQVISEILVIDQIGANTLS